MIRKAVGAIVFHGTDFLIVHKVKRSSLKNSNDSFKGEWDFPKGGIESGEDLSTALLRELEEETGSTNYQIKKQLDEKVCFAFDQDFSNKTGFIKQETTVFIVEYTGDKLDLLPKDDEIDCIEFLGMDEVLKRLTHKETKDYFIKYFKKEHGYVSNTRNR